MNQRFLWRCGLAGDALFPGQAVGPQQHFLLAIWRSCLTCNPYSRPPKGDRSDIFCIKKLFFLDIHRFSTNWIENICFIYGNRTGTRAGAPRIFQISFWPQNNPQKSNFGPQNWIAKFSTLLKCCFSFNTPVSHAKFSTPYCRKDSYGPWGSFWFSAKHVILDQ